MECGIIEPQSQYISPRLICIDTGKDQKMQRKQFHLEFLNFFIIFIGHGWTNRIWHTSGKLCVKYTNVSTSDKKIRPVYCNTLTNIYMGLQMKDKKNLIPLRGRQPHARAPQSFNCKIWSIIGEVWFSKLAFCSPSKSTNPFQKWLLYLKCLVTSRNNLGK